MELKGIIFNIVEEVISQASGPETWDELLTLTELSGIYTSLGSYPDKELMDLVAAASKLSDTPTPELLEFVGQESIPLLNERFPKFFDDAPNARTFILGLNTIIHPEVRKLYAGASCPHFKFVETPGTLTLGYNSPRKLCHLAQGFIQGLARHYGEQIAMEQPSCMHDGAPMCHIRLTWS